MEKKKRFTEKKNIHQEVRMALKLHKRSSGEEKGATTPSREKKGIGRGNPVK